MTVLGDGLAGTAIQDVVHLLDLCHRMKKVSERRPRRMSEHQMRDDLAGVIGMCNTLE
jgi:hypothetical protein